MLSSSSFRLESWSYDHITSGYGLPCDMVDRDSLEDDSSRFQEFSSTVGELSISKSSRLKMKFADFMFSKTS